MNILTHRGGIRRGFTLVELMIVISIISIILTVVFANYRKFNSKTVLLNTAYEVALAVRETQSLSMSASVSSGGSSGASKPYGIYFREHATLAGTYTIFVDSNENGVYGGLSSGEAIKTVTLGNGITIYDVTFDGAPQPRADITFVRPHLQSTFYPTTTAKEVKLELRNKSGDKQFVNISKSGRVFITAN